jgi:DNA-binding CsgD family transcriptional regulator
VQSVLVRGLNELVLLERDDVLHRLDQLVDEASASHGRLVLLGGEAGIGKSTVARAVAASAAGRVVVRVGHCDNVAAPAALGPLLDSYPELAGTIDTDLDRPALFRSLLRRLGEEPTLVVLEDVHWADAATLDFLRFLGRRVETLPALVLATYRDDEVGAGHPLAATFGDLSSSAGVERLGVVPLSVDGVRRLAEEAGSTLDPRLLHERTAGNAFYVTEVLAAAGSNVPDTVRDAVLARSSRLSEGARGVLAAAAVLGQPAELWLLTSVSGCPPAAVDECVAAGLLVGDGRRWYFRHDLARLSVEGTLLPTQRSTLHAAALSALETKGGVDAHRLASHADACEDSAAALRYAVPAAERSARLGAHRDAVELYQLALRHHPARDAERSRLCAALSYECYLTDQGEEAFEARRESMELAEDPRLIGDAERWLSRISWYLGRGEAARTWMERAVNTLEQAGEGHELAMAYSNRSQLCMLAFDTAGAVSWGTRALELARRLGDRDTEIHALNNVGSALATGGDYHDGVTMLQQSRDLALAADAHEHVARAHTNLASTSLTTRHLADGRRHLQEGIAYCVDRDLDSWAHYMRAWEPRLAEELGDFDRAQRLALDLLELPGLPPIVRVPAAATAAQVIHRQGRDGRALLAEATEQARDTGEAQRLVPVAVAWAELAWLQGRTEDIESEIDLAWAAAVAQPESWELGELSWWLRVGGVRRSVPLPVAAPFGLMLDGSWDDAARAWSELGIPYWEALSRAQAPGLEDARRALEILDRLGAVAAREAVVRDRHAAGLPVPRGPRGGADPQRAGLTARELEVLALLADGLSDVAIAEALVLSPKTVGHHVSSVLRKLEAPSRSRAVALALRRGILSQADPAPEV